MEGVFYGIGVVNQGISTPQNAQEADSRLSSYSSPKVEINRTLKRNPRWSKKGERAIKRRNNGKRASSWSSLAQDHLASLLASYSHPGLSPQELTAFIPVRPIKTYW